MGYTTPVTDRALSDITTPTSKGHFNVADWTRIYRNAQLTASLVEILLTDDFGIPTISTPTTTSIPVVTDFNGLLAGIELMRLAILADIPTLTTSIKDDWIGGVGNQSPTFEDVNLWESTIDAAWVFYDGANYDECPTLTGNLTITTGNQEIYIDCLDAANFNIDLQGTANLYIL